MTEESAEGVASRPRALAGPARVAGALAGLVVVVFGAARPELTTALRPSPRSDAAGGMGTSGGWAAGLSWALVATGAAAFLVLLLVRRRRRRRGPEPPPRQLIPLVTPLQRALALALVLLMFAVIGLVAWWLFTTGAGSGGAPPPLVRGIEPVPATPAATAPAGGSGERAASLVVGVVAALAAAGIGVALAGRWWARGRAPVTMNGNRTVLAEPADRPAPRVDDLTDFDDPHLDDRGAVVACYAELERWLGGRGAARGEAETPSEHVRRALDAGLAPAVPVRKLLGLFRLARFGQHPVTAGERRAARRALAEVIGRPGASP